jgi:hypothetical protein
MNAKVDWIIMIGTIKRELEREWEEEEWEKKKRRNLFDNVKVLRHEEREGETKRVNTP